MDRRTAWLRRLALLLGLLWMVPKVLAENPSPTPPPPAAGGPSSRETVLEDRIRQLETLVDRLSKQVEELSKKPSAPGPEEPIAAAPPATDSVPEEAGAAVSSGAEEVVGAGGSTAPSPTAAPPSPRFNMPAAVPDLPATARFGPGFEIRTSDDEFSIQFHDLTQIDFRGYEDTPKADPTTDRFDSTFGIPRQWWIFSGRLTKPFEYFVVPAFGFDAVNVLDAFLNIHYDDRLQVKIGRYKTPFMYEFYSEPVNGLVNPERSIFFNNFGLNRDLGIMAWGQLFQKRFDYAVGVFNGVRNAFIDRNNSKDIAALVNFRPFGNWEGSLLENFNVGGSVLFGNQFEPPIPRLLRTNVAILGSGFFGIPFLSFNQNVIESGDRAFWDLHVAWYVRHLSLLAEWASGFQDYAFLSSPGVRTRLPAAGFYVQAGYFLTGETVANRGVVKPLRDFDIRHGKLGLGAMELAARYSTLNIGPEVFTQGLSDPNLWSNRAYLIDVGVNWYLTQYVKVYLGWQYAAFGNPVFLDPNRFQLTNDMYWARFQIYF